MKVNRVPKQFQIEILARRLSPEQIDELAHEYDLAKFNTMGPKYSPSAKELKLFDKFLKKQTTIKDVALELKLTTTTVRSHFGIIALQKLSD